MDLLKFSEEVNKHLKDIDSLKEYNLGEGIKEKVEETIVDTLTDAISENVPIVSKEVGKMKKIRGTITKVLEYMTYLRRILEMLRSIVPMKKK